MLILLLVVFSGQILWALGAVLVIAEQPVKADLVVVLAGDSTGNRVLKGARLVRDGFAPRMLISNGQIIFGHPESELAADFAVSRGFDRSTMIRYLGLQHSTAEEARNLGAEMRRMGVHSFLLVTSPSHTARATRLFRRSVPEIQAHTVAAPDPSWCGGQWWTARECQKTWFQEALKTVTAPFGI